MGIGALIVLVAILLVAAVVGIALLIVSVAYKRGQPSAEEMQPKEE